MSRESGTVRQAVPKKTSRAKQLIVKLTLWQFKSLEILIQYKKFTLVADILPGQCSIAECSVWENSQSNGPALELPHLTSPSSRDVKAKSTAAATCQNMKPKTKSCTVTSLQNPWFSLPCKNVNSATRELHKLWRCPLTLSELHKVVHCKQDGQIVSKTWQGTWLQRMGFPNDYVDTELWYLDIRCLKIAHWCTYMHISCPDSPCLHEICINADWLGEQAPDHWLSTDFLLDHHRAEIVSRNLAGFKQTLPHKCSISSMSSFSSDATGHTNSGFAYEAAMI